MKTKISAILVSVAIVLGVLSLYSDSTAGGGGLSCHAYEGNTPFACSSDICDNASNNPEDVCWKQVD